MKTPSNLMKVSMDFVGPLPLTKNGNQWILMLPNYFTHWPVAYALPSSSAELVARKLVEYVSIYGFSKELLKDWCKFQIFSGKTTL